MDNMNPDEAFTSSIPDMKKKDTVDAPAGNIASFVREKFRVAANARRGDEERWLRAYRNYRGIYGSDVQFTSTEKSKVFIKVTKTKVNAAYNQITEVLFGSNKFPITINPTTLPEGVAESVYIDVQGSPQGAPQQPDTKLQPGETLTDLNQRLGALKKTLAPVMDKVKEGPGSGPTQVAFHPAMVSAKKMEKKIQDQLEESDASKHLRSSTFECALFGTGIMKGPFIVNKEYPKWDDQGTYAPVMKIVPNLSHVSVWNFYPDPDAYNMNDTTYCVERHKLSRTQLRALKQRPLFRSNSIDAAITFGEAYSPEWWETEMEDDDTRGPDDRFEVLEFWGFVDIQKLKDYGVDLPADVKGLEEVSANIWVCNGMVLRLALNPFKPSYIPYYAVPYELNPYSFFGVGVAENMDDTQTVMNGFMRMAIDNAALSGNMIIEIDETNLVPGQDMNIYPGKVFRREGGAPGQAIFGTKFPNVSNENMQMFDKARQLADESTGFPSFAHGQTGVTGVGRTASGISMLMSAANGTIRGVIKNFDDYLLSPMGKALFRFNMQFDHDPDIKGDLEVRAEGTDSLMANEVRSQRLMQFLGVVQNPILAPFAKMDYIIREIAKSMDLDPDKVANSMGDAAIQAEIMKKFQAENPQAMPQGGPQGQPQQAPAGLQARDTQGSGGGNMGTGTAPTPGEQGFSANTGMGMPQ